jgi:hypothetical protein
MVLKEEKQLTDVVCCRQPWPYYLTAFHEKTTVANFFVMDKIQPK